ncbi:MAG: hypothetical protein ACT4OU_09095 [Hyphomicrobium sp.]
MIRAAWTVTIALGSALLVATCVALGASLPAVSPIANETASSHALRTAMALSASALPGALLAIALSEARRVRGLIFWLFAGVATAATGAALNAETSSIGDLRVWAALFATGLAAGWTYWRLAGRRAGHLAAAIARWRNGGAPPTL